QADIKRSTLETLARPMLANDYAALRRVLAERAAAAGGIVEDGSAASLAGAGGAPPDLGADRARHPGPPLVGEATGPVVAPPGAWARRGGRGLSSAPPRRATSVRCARGRASRRAPSTTGRRWICPPRSIAATSGTTFRSTTPARACRSRASASPRSRCTSA